MFAEGLKTNLPTDLLRTLVTVCEFRSFTKAAQLLQLTDPVVIQQIEKLELIVGSLPRPRGNGCGNSVLPSITPALP